MKKSFLYSILFIVFINSVSADETLDFSILPKTDFTQEIDVDISKKTGFVASEGQSTKNKIDETLPDKRLLRGFERFKKVDAFGDELSDEFLFYRNELTPNEKSAYDEVYKSLMNFDESLRIVTRISKNDFPKVIEAVYYDNPELFWWAGNYRWCYNNDGTVTFILFDYLFPKSEMKSLHEKFMSMSFPVVFYASMLDSDMDKIKYIHDYLCLSIEYDYVAFNSGNYGGKLQTAYSAICEYKTVCAGYSRAFAYYLQQLRIPCAVLWGSGHAWNMVKIGGDFYQMDVTWNDNNNIPPYFNLSHEQMQRVNMHTPSTIPAKIIRNHPTRTDRMAYRNYFGTIPIGKPYSYKEFKNIQRDIENPLFAEIYKLR